MSKSLNYKDAFDELQTIVSDIELGEISVDELAEKVKRATVLIKICKTKLATTEEDVNMILKEPPEHCPVYAAKLQPGKIIYSGIGIGLLPKNIIEKSSKYHLFKQLPPFPHVSIIPISLAWHKDRELSLLEQYFINDLRSVFNVNHSKHNE